MKTIKSSQIVTLFKVMIKKATVSVILDITLNYVFKWQQLEKQSIWTTKDQIVTLFKVAKIKNASSSSVLLVFC